MDKITWEWLGGFWDGEGSFSLGRGRGMLAGVLSAQVCQVGDVGFVAISKIQEFLAEHGIVSHIGGKTADRKRGNPGTKTCWHLSVSNRPQIEKFIPLILPHLRLKRTKALDCWRWARIYRASKGRHAIPYPRRKTGLLAVQLKCDRESGMRYSEIAEKHGLSYFTVYYALTH